MIDNFEFTYKRYHSDYGPDSFFEREEEVGLTKGGCSVVFMGTMMHFGGATNPKHYRIMDDCGLELQYPPMPVDNEFDLYDGACNSFLKPTPKVLLCFNSQYDKAKDCFT